MYLIVHGLFFYNMKPFKTYEEQLALLKSRHLLPLNPMDCSIAHVIDAHGKNISKILLPVTSDSLRSFALCGMDEQVLELLKTYGYYNIINQYNKPFLNSDGSYQSGIDFFKLYSLQQIDYAMENALFYSLLQIERHLKISISYEFAKHYGPFEGDDITNYTEPYLQKTNYNQSLRTRKGELKCDCLIRHLNKIYSDHTYKPFIHYKKVHHHIPIWVFSNKFTFGELIHFYEVLKIQNKISVQFNLTPSQLRTSMAFLHCVRNDCAHFTGFYNQNYPQLKGNIPLVIDFMNKYGFNTVDSIPNLFLVLILFKYFLSENDYHSVLRHVTTSVFVQIFECPIPKISEYMQDMLSVKDKNDCKSKLDFLLYYKIS